MGNNAFYDVVVVVWVGLAAVTELGVLEANDVLLLLSSYRNVSCNKPLPTSIAHRSHSHSEYLVPDNGKQELL